MYLQRKPLDASVYSLTYALMFNSKVGRPADVSFFSRSHQILRKLIW
jgi:hypothetical protein